jgi:hypothetical protein
MPSRVTESTRMWTNCAKFPLTLLDLLSAVQRLDRDVCQEIHVMRRCILADHIPAHPRMAAATFGNAAPLSRAKSVSHHASDVYGNFRRSTKGPGNTRTAKNLKSRRQMPPLTILLLIGFGLGCERLTQKTFCDCFCHI